MKVKNNIDLSKNAPLSQLVYEGLKKSIILGDIPVGTRINESHYADALNISRTPIREAIKQILYEGLLEYVPGKGTIVSQTSIDDIKEIYELRYVLEKLCFEKAAKNISDYQLDEMEKMLIYSKTCYESNRIEEAIEISKQFNMAIIDAAQSPRLANLINNLKHYLSRIRYLSLSDQKDGLEVINEHLIIIRCMRNRSKDQMDLVIKDHIFNSYQRIMRKITTEDDNS